MDRFILHLDLDTFFVSVERLKRPELNGKPVIVGGSSDRAVVSSCSYEARRFGIHAGMPMKTAGRLCPEARIIGGDMESYSFYSRQVSEIVSANAPLFEKASIDEFYLDISGMDRFYGSLQWSVSLRNRIMQETGLPLSFGLSVNKTLAKMATCQAKPNGTLFVPRENVQQFLAPLSIQKIPMLGEKSFRILQSMGIETIGSLSRVAPNILQKALGVNGIELWRRANGIDNNPVIPYEEARSVSNETTFEKDTADQVFMLRVVTSLVEHLGFRLRGKNRLTGCITVKIRYANFETHTSQYKIVYTAFDHVLSVKARELFLNLYQRGKMVRLVGVRLSDLVNGKPQLDLFTDTPELSSLYTSLDTIRKRYGESSICHAQKWFLKPGAGNDSLKK